MTLPLPAWADAFSSDLRAALARQDAPFGRLDRASVFGDADGRGVTVAIVDSGVEAGHPVLAGHRIRQLRVDLAEDEATVVDDPEGHDLVGHGTACAGIVASVAPAAEIVSLRMLGADNRGKGRALAAAIEWTVSQRIAVVNLSLSSRSEQMYPALHDIADRSYFANTLLVCAANNARARRIPRSSRASYRSRRTMSRPGHLVLQPITARRVRCVWGRCGCRVARRRKDPRDRQLLRRPASGGSGGRLRSRYPGATPFEIKALLAATASVPA
jgi:hypothetical protein